MCRIIAHISRKERQGADKVSDKRPSGDYGVRCSDSRLKFLIYRCIESREIPRIAAASFLFPPDLRSASRQRDLVISLLMSLRDLFSGNFTVSDHSFVDEAKTPEASLNVPGLESINDLSRTFRSSRILPGQL